MSANGRSTGRRSLAARLVALAVTVLAAHGAAAGSNAWTLISSTASGPAPNWSPPDQGTGSYPRPALADLNGDGKTDVLFGNADGSLTAYENTGSASAPAWTAAPAAWSTLSAPCSTSTTFYVPALSDLNGDGLPDLVIGTRDGVCIYQNTGTVSAPVWTYNSGWRTGLSTLTGNRFYRPTLSDLDGDGKIDMVLGSSLAGTLGYKNTGTLANPAWTAEPSWDSSFVTVQSAPALADLDGDGLADLLIADQDGNIFAFKNMGTASAPQWTYAPAWSPILSGSTTNTLPYVGVVAGDLNGDGKPDLMYSRRISGTQYSTAVYEHNPAGMPAPGSASGAPPPAAGTTVTDTFDGFSCTGAWVQAATGPTLGISGTYTSYVRDCGNGWTAYAEDVGNPYLTPYPYTNGPVGDQNVVAGNTGVNGPSAQAGSPLGAAELQFAPANTARGVLWLLKTFPVNPGVPIQTLTADYRMSTSGRQYLGMVVFDGIVTDPSGQTGVTQVPLRPDVLAYNIVLDGAVQCGTNPCPWHTADLGGTQVTPTHSYITVAFEVHNTSTSETPIMGIDNLTVSNVVDELPVNVPTGNVAQVWAADYQASGTNSGGQSSNSAEPKAVAADAAGNVYVAGDSYNGLNYDIVTFKYDPAGNLLWSATYDGGSADQAAALAVDAAGNVYVTGRSYSSGSASDDYVVVKYDSSGAQQWVTTYDDLNRNDAPSALAVDGGGNVYVTGSSCSGPADCKIATVKLEPVAGAVQWQAVFDDGGAATVSTAAGIGLDSGGNVYVAGSSGGAGADSIVALKYDGTGAQLRLNRYQTGQDEQARVMATDAAGDVYIAGVTTANAGNLAMVVLKYAAGVAAGGAPQWVRLYDAAFETIPAALALDAGGNVYVTGTTGAPGSFDFITVKYLAGGDTAWLRTFGSAGEDDGATGVALDGSGNVYVVGSFTRNAGNTDMLLLKYDSTGVARSAITYDGHTVNDTPVGLVLNVDSDGDIAPVVVGTSADGTGVDHIDTVGYEKAYADLTMTALSGPASGSVGNAITVANTVLNIDDVANKKHQDSGAFTVALYLAPDVGGSADLTSLTPLGTRTVTNLTPGQSSADGTTVTIPMSTAQGSYYLVAVADSTGVVLERDETNNELVSGATIDVTASDLVVSDISAPTSVQRDTAFDVTTTVTDAVASAAPAGTSFRVGIYLSADPTITTGDILIGSRTVSGGLAGFASNTATTSVTIPSSTVPAGNYYIGAIADDQNAVAEADETNNAAVLLAPTNSTLLSTDSDFSPGLSVSGTADAAVIGTGSSASVQLAKDTSATSLAWQLQSGWALPSGPAFDLGDLDGDGLPDLLIGSQNANSYVFAYKNTGTASAPAWTTEETGWEINTTAQQCDIGGAQYSRPYLVDLNGDGLLDMVVAIRNGVCIYQNTGTSTTPAWTRNTTWETGLTTLATNKFYSAAAADLNGDGLPDLMIGYGGSALGYMNTGTASSPAWTATPAWDSPSISGRANPALADLDGDGLPDLLLGSTTGGTVYAYHNTGTTGAPAWTRFASWDLTGLGNASTIPSLADVDGDGRIDLVLASSGGNGAYKNVQGYYATGTYLSPVIDAGTHDGFSTLSYVVSAAAGTALTVDVRAGGTPVPDGSWTTLTGIADGGDISPLGTNRYLQYQFNLSTSNSLASPALYNIQAATQAPPQPVVVSVLAGAPGASGGGALSWPALLVLAWAAAAAAALRRRGRAA